MITIISFEKSGLKKMGTLRQARVNLCTNPNGIVSKGLAHRNKQKTGGGWGYLTMGIKHTTNCKAHLIK